MTPSKYHHTFNTCNYSIDRELIVGKVLLIKLIHHHKIAL